MNIINLVSVESHNRVKYYKKKYFRKKEKFKLKKNEDENF